LTPPKGTYVQLLSRSGQASKKWVDVKAGVIDRDYTGNIQVLLHNYGDEPFEVKIGNRITQMVIINIETPSPTQVEQLKDTKRGSHGFGSTGHSAIISNIKEEPPDTANIPDLPYDLYLSQDPFDSILDVTIPIRGDYNTLGMQLQSCPHRF
jgi:dUTP pyrophosphatase